MIHFTIYIILLTIMLLINRRLLSKFSYILIMIFSAIIAFRTIVSYPDTFSYKFFFENLNVSMDFTQEKYFEAGFTIISLFIKKFISENYLMYFFVIAAIQLTLIYFALKYFAENEKYQLNNPINVLIIFLYTFGFGLLFVTIRSGLAFSILLLGYSVLLNKDRVMGFLIILFSMAFHNSSIFFILYLILAYIIRERKKSFYYLWIVILIPIYFFGQLNLYSKLFIYILELIPVMQNRFIYYLNDQLIMGSTSTHLRFAILLLIAVLILKNKRFSASSALSLNIYLISLTMFSMLTTFSVIGRVTEHGLAISMLLINLDDKPFSLNITKLLNLLIVIYFIISNFRLLIL